MKTEAPLTRRLPVTHHPWRPGCGNVPEMLDATNNNNNTINNNVNPTISYSNNNNNNTRNTTITNINNATANINNSSSNSSSNSSNRAAAAAAVGGQSGESRGMKLPTIGERRSSVTSERRMSLTGPTMRKPRASSLNDALAEMSTAQRRGSLSTEGPALPAQRRASVPQGTAPVQPSPARRGSKLTFQGAGRRVSMLVKYRQAFQARNKAALQEDEEDENPMEAIREMPHSPRFSTFMSAEAQYAMMKGYEDKLYEKISGCNPEVRTSLQRTKTPYQKKISIVDQDKGLKEQKQQDDDDDEEEEEGVGRSRDSSEVQSSSSLTSSSNSGSMPARTRTLSVSAPLADVLNPSDNRSSATSSPSPGPVTISVPYLKPLRRQSLASTSPADPNGNGLNPLSSMESSLENLHLQRCHSLPALEPPAGLSLSKRLVLTYRLESAMDLLDSLKHGDSEHALSPRVGRRGQDLKQQGDVVKNFNCWTQVWNKEFKEIHTK